MCLQILATAAAEHVVSLCVVVVVRLSIVSHNLKVDPIAANWAGGPEREREKE